MFKVYHFIVLALMLSVSAAPAPQGKILHFIPLDDPITKACLRLVAGAAVQDARADTAWLREVDEARADTAWLREIEDARADTAWLRREAEEARADTAWLREVEEARADTAWL